MTTVYRVQGPDGQVHQFAGPDNASQSDVMQVAQAQFGGGAQSSAPQPQPQPQPKAGSPSDTLGLYQGGMHVLDNAATFAKWAANKIPVPGMNEGLGDAVDQVGGLIGLPSVQNAVQGHANYLSGQAAKGRVPSARGRIAGEIAATLPTLALPGGVLAQGAAAGGLSTNSSDPRDIATDMALGAAGGKAGEYVGGALGNGVKALLRKAPAAPTTEAIKDAARTAYKQADNSNMIISGNAMRDLTQNIQDDLTNKGVDATLHPRAVAAYSRIANAATDPKTGGNVTLQGLDTLRKVAGQAANSIEPSDKYMGHVIQDNIDSFMDTLGPQHVVGSLDKTGLDALTNARQLWNTARKSEIIDTALGKAENSASNLTQGGSDNALRTSFRQIANNPKIFSKYNPAEQAAIIHVIRGGKVSNALRQLGKLAPRGVVSAGMDAALGAGTGVGIMPMMLAGEAGRAGSAMATRRAANAASEIVRGGGKAAAPLPQAVQNPLALAQYSLRAIAPPITTVLQQQWQQ